MKKKIVKLLAENARITNQNINDLKKAWKKVPSPFRNETIVKMKILLAEYEKKQQKGEKL